MNTPISPNRRRTKARIALETLEARELLTGGAGNTFAITPGNITTAGGSAAVTFTIDHAHFTLPKNTMTLGVDVVAQSATSLKPQISSVKGPDGRMLRVSHARYDTHVQRSNPADSKLTSAVSVPISFPRDSGDKPATFTVNVSALQKGSGKFLLGFYIPGDANGDGSVTNADVTATRKLLGANGNESRYSFYADANRDGRINSADLSLTRRNMGVKVTVTPIVTSNLNPASVSQTGSRITNHQAVNFTGNATPGATITYTNTTDGGKAQTVTTDTKGDYSVDIPLVSGSNNMTLTTHDSFGQSISGAIDPVTYFASTSSS